MKIAMASATDSSSSSHFTPPFFFFQLVFLLLLLLIFAPSSHSAPLNITSLLSSYPDLSDFSHLLSSTSIPSELTSRSSLTLLVVPNKFLRPALSRLPSSADLPDVLRHHVLLQYLSWPDIRRLPASGTLITTLFQTTGRALSSSGSLNLTRSSSGDVVVVSSPASNATVVSLVTTIPYNLSIFSVNSLLIPYPSDIAASENRPSLALNVTRVLIDARTFNVAASMLAASGVADEFEADERGAGITVFIPTDAAFAELPATERLQSLPAERKAVVLKFHVLHSYYPLGSLESIVNPVQPTLATEEAGAGTFTLNITRVNGSVAIDTGIVQASITQTVFDQNPVAIFAVSRVLLPKEVFGMAGKAGGEAPAPELGAAPESSVPGFEMPPTLLTAPPPSLFNDIQSSAIDCRRGVAAAAIAAAFQFCIVLCFMP